MDSTCPTGWCWLLPPETEKVNSKLGGKYANTWDSMDLAWKALFAVAPSATNSEASCLASLQKCSWTSDKKITCTGNVNFTKRGIITYPLLRSPLSRSRQSNCSWVTSGYFLHKVPNSRLTWRREDKWIGFSNIQLGISVLEFFRWAHFVKSRALFK